MCRQSLRVRRMQASSERSRSPCAAVWKRSSARPRTAGSGAGRGAAGGAAGRSSRSEQPAGTRETSSISRRIAPDCSRAPLEVADAEFGVGEERGRVEAAAGDAGAAVGGADLAEVLAVGAGAGAGHAEEAGPAVGLIDAGVAVAARAGHPAVGVEAAVHADAEHAVLARAAVADHRVAVGGADARGAAADLAVAQAEVAVAVGVGSAIFLAMAAARAGRDAVVAGGAVIVASAGHVLGAVARGQAGRLPAAAQVAALRSEERRVGKEW